MIFNDDYSAAGFLGGSDNCSGIDRLYRVSIDHSNGNAFAFERLCCGERFMQCDSRSDYSYAVIRRFPHNL